MSITEDADRAHRKRLEKLEASERLVAAFREDVGFLLDEEVHDVKSAEAADINNSGLQAQIDYLLDAGYTEHQIRDLLEMEK